MPGRLAGDRISGAIRAVVEIVFQKENEVAAALLGWRCQRIPSKNSRGPFCVAQKANIAWAGPLQQGLIARLEHDDIEAVRCSVHDVAARTVRDPLLVKRLGIAQGQATQRQDNCSYAAPGSQIIHLTLRSWLAPSRLYSCRKMIAFEFSHRCLTARSDASTRNSATFS